MVLTAVELAIRERRQKEKTDGIRCPCCYKEVARDTVGLGTKDGKDVATSHHQCFYCGSEFRLWIPLD